MALKVCGVYRLTNLVNGKNYVGMSIDIRRRWKGHKKPRAGFNLPILNAIRKYGVDAFRFEILEECSREQLPDRERHWIKECGSFVNGYNCTTGGDGHFIFADSTRAKMGAAKRGHIPWNKGVPATPEMIEANRRSRQGSRWSPGMRAKMEAHYADPAFSHKLSESAKKAATPERMRRHSELLKGRKLSDEQRAKISAGLKGHIVTKETRALIAAKTKSKVLSEESKQKISRSLTGRKQSPETIAKRVLKLRGRKMPVDALQRAWETRRKALEI